MQFGTLTRCALSAVKRIAALVWLIGLALPIFILSQTVVCFGLFNHTCGVEMIWNRAGALLLWLAVQWLLTMLIAAMLSTPPKT